MPVQLIEDDASFQLAYNDAGSSLIVIDFFATWHSWIFPSSRILNEYLYICYLGKKKLPMNEAYTWCGPCRVIAPVFEELSDQYMGVVFLKVDVDKCPNTQQIYSIRAMPTFLFIRDRQTLHTLKGANQQELRDKVHDFSLDPSIATSNTTTSGIGVPGMINLASEISMSQLTCLNESDDHEVKYIFEENDDLFLESDCDPELLISMEFNQLVKLHSLKILAPHDFGPKSLRLFINQPHNMDFDSARDGKSVQDIVLTKDDISGDNLVNLKFVKFQNVNNLTIFIPDNQGDEETTKVQKLTIIGKTVATTNMSDFKRVAGKQGESH